MNKTITVSFINGQTKDYPKGTPLIDISKDLAALYSSPIVSARLNNRLCDLQTKVTVDSNVVFYDMSTEEGNRVYRNSLAFVLIVATKEVFPDGELTVEHSLSKGLYCELHLGRRVTAQDIKQIEEKMRQIVEDDIPINKAVMPIQDAIELFKKNGQLEKAKLLQQLHQDTVTLYNLDNIYDNMYGVMVPSTGYLKLFELKYYFPGFLLRYPAKDRPEKLPDFVEQPKLAMIFREAEQWGKILECSYVSTLNEYVNTKRLPDIIRVAEALHEKKIAQIADFIAQHKETVRVILIAGPSSSGKTTFAQRLSIQLRVNGVRPVPISLDDYFIDRDKTPLDENGEYDFEAIEALDLELFNEHLLRLLNGETVELPTYNFMTGMREYRGKYIQLEENQPLVIEGIHGLNERLTKAVPRIQKIKIYISALTQLSIDNHNRIPTTDARLIRRLVRDSQFRSHNAQDTLKMWMSVRRGEDRNIFPFQEDADVMFNSALIYELAVLKKYAVPLLEKVTEQEDVYPEAQRLLNFLGYFCSVEDEAVPNNSILREFIGNSCFF